MRFTDVVHSVSLVNGLIGNCSVSQNVSVVQETEKMLAPLCSADFFPAALSCAEVASILHRTLVEPSRSTSRDAGDAAAATSEEVSFTLSLTI